MIENVAINQLEARRERLVAQQIQARFGVADSYDQSFARRVWRRRTLMLRRAIPIVVVSAFLGGCTAHHKPANTQGTLADLQKVAPDVKDAETKESVDQAMQQYRKFLEESPETPMTPEAIRRLADLELEKEYGIHTGEGKPKPMPAPESAKAPASKPAAHAQ